MMVARTTAATNPAQMHPRAPTTAEPKRVAQRRAEPMKAARTTAETNLEQMHPQAPTTAGPKTVA